MWLHSSPGAEVTKTRPRPQPRMLTAQDAHSPGCSESWFLGSFRILEARSSICILKLPACPGTSGLPQASPVLLLTECPRLETVTFYSRWFQSPPLWPAACHGLEYPPRTDLNPWQGLPGLECISHWVLPVCVGDFTRVEGQCSDPKNQSMNMSYFTYHLVTLGLPQFLHLRRPLPVQITGGLTESTH